MNNFIDLTGQTFNYLTVIEKGKKSNHGYYWKCKCKCGNLIEVRGDCLKSGKSKSCGCYQKEKIKEIGHKNAKDLTNMRFGKLIAIEPISERKRGNIVWKCKCDCGNEHYATSAVLLRGDTLSCGRCLKSKGEMIISYLLKDNNIFFTTQAHFDTCKFENGYYGYFDFYVDNKYLIEFDGEQHFNYNSRGWNNQEYFRKIQQHDNIKNNWCKDNNIPLIRIPYTKLDTLCIEDLLLDKTEYLI